MLFNYAIAIPPTSVGGAVFTAIISIQHIVPFVLVLFEWWHNSIVVTTDRFELYLLIGLAYIMMLYALAMFFYPDVTIYHSIDFDKAPL